MIISEYLLKYFNFFQEQIDTSINRNKILFVNKIRPTNQLITNLV